MGGPYLCRLLPLRSPSASSIPDCLTSLSAGLWWGLAGVKGGEERQAIRSYIKCQCYLRHRHTPPFPHPPTCPVVGLCVDHGQSDAAHSVQHPVGLNTHNFDFHICSGETAMRKENSEETLELIGLLSDKTFGKPNSCQLPSGSKETRKIPHGHIF